MPRSLTIGSQTFDIPLQGEAPDYGENLTEFFTAIADSLSDIVGPSDILLTTATIANNQSSPANIPGFAYSTSTVKTIKAEYIIERSTSTPSVVKVENGFIEGNYDGTSWNISIRTIGNSDTTLSITSGGQIQYISSNMTGAGYSGIIRFRSQSITV